MIFWELQPEIIDFDKCSRWVDDADWNSVTNFWNLVIEHSASEPTEITICVLEVLEDANKVVDGIFKPGEKAFSVSKSCCR